MHPKLEAKLRSKYKGKAHWLKVNEFIFGHYGTLEVSEELLKLYKKYIL